MIHLCPIMIAVTITLNMRATMFSVLRFLFHDSIDYVYIVKAASEYINNKLLI